MKWLDWTYYAVLSMLAGFMWWIYVDGFGALWGTLVWAAMIMFFYFYVQWGRTEDRKARQRLVEQQKTCKHPTWKCKTCGVIHDP